MAACVEKDTSATIPCFRENAARCPTVPRYASPLTAKCDTSETSGQVDKRHVGVWEGRFLVELLRHTSLCLGSRGLRSEEEERFDMLPPHT